MMDSHGIRAARRDTVSWMLTFADLSALMLTFFVMLFAMSNVETEKWDKLMAMLSRRIDPEIVKRDQPGGVELGINKVFRRHAIDLDYLATLLERQIARVPALDGALLGRTEDGLVISLPGRLLFARNSAELTDRAREGLFALGGLFHNLGNRIEVHGHADPSPVTGGFFRSNWDLSLMRAIAVADGLKAAGYRREIVPVGLADSRYGDLPGDLPAAVRDALARRVDIVVRSTVARDGSGGGP